MAYLPSDRSACPRPPSGRSTAGSSRWRTASARPAPTGTASPGTCCSSSGTPASTDYDALVERSRDAPGRPRRAPEPGSAQRHARARVLRRRRPRAVRAGEAAALALAELRPLAARCRQRPPGRPLPPAAGAAPLRAAAAATSSASTSSSSPTATTSRSVTTASSTATCCSTTAAASRWATGSASPTTPTSTATPTASWTRRT